MSAVLAIDTASPAFALALARDGEDEPFAVAAEEAFGHAALLAAVGDRLRGQRLEAVVAVRGPGAYSGLRAGLAAAQGLALARGCALAGLSTLEAVAAARPSPALTAIHPAGRGQFAVQRFRAGAPHGPMRLAAPHEFAGEAPLAGEGAEALGGREVVPRERALAALARWRAGALAPADGLAAIYAREPAVTPPRRPFGPAGAQRPAPAR